MQTISIQKASDLSAAVKAAVEQLLGRTLAADEEISIVASPPQQALPSESREAVARRLEAFLDRRAGKVKDISAEDTDAAIDDAVEHVRHSRT
jgi:hypothetical protein